MSKYRKKPIVIEAVRWDGENVVEVTALLDGGGKLRFGDVIEIRTLEGTMTARKGDWIIKGVKGEVYPCRDEIFRATYDETSS